MAYVRPILEYKRFVPMRGWKPDEAGHHTLGFRVQRYGMVRWRDLFTPRQLLTITTLVRLVREAMAEDRTPNGLGVAVRSCLAHD